MNGTESFWDGVLWGVLTGGASVVAVFVALAFLKPLIDARREDRQIRKYEEAYDRAKGKEAAKPPGPGDGGGEEGDEGRDEAHPCRKDTGPADDTVTLEIGVKQQGEECVRYVVRIDFGELLRLVRLATGTTGFGACE